MNDIDYPIPFIDLVYLHTDCSSLLVLNIQIHAIY